MVKKSFLILLFSLGIVSCKSDAEDMCTTDDFDRGAMLTNWAENIIIPSYENYVDKVNVLNLDVATFVGAPSENHLQTVRTSWIAAYKAWQKVAMFQIGEAEELRLRSYANSFPLDAIGVESNISSGIYDLKLSTQIDRQGFPALDYLLNGLGETDTEIVAVYDDSNYGVYLTTVSNRLEQMGQDVLNDWKGAYKTVFIQNECSSATASVDKLTNDFIYNFEKRIRVTKIGKPIGFFDDTPIPEEVEAFYKQDISKELLITAIEASRDFFSGKHFNSDTEGAGLKSYLTDLNIEAGGRSLSTVILEKMDKALATANGLESNFYNQISADRNAFIAMRSDLHSVVEVLKTNMIAALKIKADFNDTDGD